MEEPLAESPVYFEVYRQPSQQQMYTAFVVAVMLLVYPYLD